MSKCAMVIDDDPVVRMLVKEILGAEGYNVREAENGRKGCESLEGDPAVNIVILDVNMPDMGGLDALTRLRVHSKTQSLPVIMLTGEDKPDDIMAGYGVGADYYITKPFTRDQLLYGLNLVLDQKN